jgi:hypothetical protein
MQAGEEAEQPDRGALGPLDLFRSPASPGFRLLEVRSFSKRFGSLRALETDSVSEFADYVVSPAAAAAR